MLFNLFNFKSVLWSTFFLVNFVYVEGFKKDPWQKNSWRNKSTLQQPKYDNLNELVEVEQVLGNSVPLVIADEITGLKNDLKLVGEGEKFLFMGGDCAETFREHSADNIIKNFQLFMISTILLMNGTGKEVVKIARMAGQFCKPRSKDTETVDGTEYMAYKGDMINLEPLDKRKPNPFLMLRGYNQCVQTMNLLRILKQSCFSNINISEWETELEDSIYKMSSLSELIDKLKENLRFLDACGINNSNTHLNNVELYTGHEGLLLNYEEALTRKDRYTNNYFDCSAHFLWIGERTRNLDGGHIEFFRGIENPIGVKISDKIDKDELLKMLFILNPDNEMGRVTLITRMGEKINDKLPELIDTIEQNNRKVVWVCDPMHANGITEYGKKTRNLEDVSAEIESFLNIHTLKGTVPGGIHLEMTGKDVTECLGGKYLEEQSADFLNKNYETSCDPRLNFFQTIEIIEEIIEQLTLIDKFKTLDDYNLNMLNSLMIK